MEKKKGLFSFRKQHRRIHRVWGMLLAIVLICSTLPVSGLTVSAGEGTPDLELFGQQICSGDSGDGWSYADGVLTLENFHSDNSSGDFIHVTNADLEFTLYLKGDNSVKTSERLIYGNAFGKTTITGDPGSSLSLDGKSWADRYIFIRGVNVNVTTQGMIFISYDMEIDSATVNISMSGSNGYIYTTHGGFTVKNGSDVTIMNSSGVVDYCVATNKAEITDSILNLTNPSGFGVYVTALSKEVPEHRALITNSTISADVSDAAVHCEDEMSVTGSHVTGSGRFLLRSKKGITVDESSRMEGITYEFFKSDTGEIWQVYGSHTPAANLTVAENGSLVIPEGAALTIPDGVTLENNGTMHIHDQTSLAGTGALTGSGKFRIDVNEDMISVPEGLAYTGEDYTDQVALEGSVTICGVEFTADTEGWMRHIEPAVVKDAGEYRVTFTKGDQEISKTFSVAECPHTGLTFRQEENDKHSGTCTVCGAKVEEDCEYPDSYKSTADGHVYTCTVCGGTRTEAHTSELTATASGNTVTLSKGCGTAGCGYQTTLGTASFTFPKVSYGQSGNVTCTWDGPAGYYGLIEVVGGSQSQFDKNADEDVAERSWTLAELFGSTEVTAGGHKLKVSFFSAAAVWSDECELNFTIDPAPLTDSMVTLDQTVYTYNGIEQKPTLTVKQGQTTLAEGTDYEVSRTRDGVVTTDFTSAGTVKNIVTGKGNYTGTVTKEYTIRKADVPADALTYTPPADLVYSGQPKTAAVTADNLTGIGAITVKYKKDNSGDLLAEAEESGTYHVYADISAGQNYNAAQIEMGSFTIEKAPGREVPDVSGSYTDNGQTYTYTVTPTEGAVYRMEDGAWQAEPIFEGITPGTSVTFYAKIPGDQNHEEGTAKDITVAFPKLTPAAPALSYIRKTTEETGEITITITPVSGAEYSFDGGQTWTDESGKGGFTASDTVPLAIRLKETDTHNPSPAQTMAVNLAKGDREAPPAFSLKAEANGETDYTVTIPATEGCEYSFDGETWTDNNVKTGVSVGETVTGYKRYKETDDYNAGSAGSAKETMPKFTVKTPVIAPAEGSYEGSISVTITCGSPDAKIYYTTDGRTPDRSCARYTGAFPVTVPATVKAVAIKDGLNDSAVASAAYTKKSGGGSGGGNEDNGGQGSGGGGGSTNPGNGTTAPQAPVTAPVNMGSAPVNPGSQSTPGTGTTPVNPGSGKTVRPGTAPGSGTGTPAQGTEQPFIKGEDGKTGWDVIRAEGKRAQEGSTINVDMNGAVVVPGDIFDSMKGKDITITFDMGSGILWSVDGKSITTDRAGDIDFSVKTGVNTVPVDIVNKVTGENYSIQLSLAYEGEFGFTAVLSIGLGAENAGYTAILYYYNENTGELELICSDEIAKDGTASFAFTHASDYVIAIDGDEEEESGDVTEPVQSESLEKDSAGEAENVRSGQTWRLWWILAVILLMAVAGAGVVAVKKRKNDKKK